jgi:hypothetical protein
MINDKWIECYRSKIRWMEVAITGIEAGMSGDEINRRWSLPINVRSPKILDSYTSALEKEVARYILNMALRPE